MTKEVDTDLDGSVDTSEYTYDSNGNVTKIVWTYVSTHSDEIIIIYEYTYDSNGNETRLIAQIQTGVLTSNSTYTYDSNGNITKRVYTDFDGNVTTNEYTYDSNGNVTKKFILIQTVNLRFLNGLLMMLVD